MGGLALPHSFKPFIIIFYEPKNCAFIVVLNYESHPKAVEYFFIIMLNSPIRFYIFTVQGNSSIIFWGEKSYKILSKIK